jgi:hypothetical protein
MECVETCPYQETIKSLIRSAEENQKDHERIRNDNTETKFLVKDVQTDVKLIRVDISNIIDKINVAVYAPVKRREKILIGVTIGCVVSCFGAIMTLVISLIK